MMDNVRWTVSGVINDGGLYDCEKKLIEWEDAYDQAGSSEVFLEAMRDCLKYHISK